jgi:hypothetical protein
MTRRALLVGVQHSEAADLLGPQNDVDAMQAVLETDRFGFEVEALPDLQKTRAHIESALRTMVEQTEGVDSLLFYYSGHGMHVQVPNRAEVECEAIVPSDYDDGLDHLAIKEFELHEWLRPAIERGAKVTVILDCCFAGGMPPFDVLRRIIQRAGDPVRKAFEAVPGELVEDLGLIGIRTIPRRRAALEGLLRSRPRPPSTFARASDDDGKNAMVVFGACKASEFATEREFDGSYRGVFTHYLVGLMIGLASGATNSDVLDTVRELILNTTKEQTPIAYPSQPAGVFLP